MAKEGVPPETRGINQRTYATRFLRPMPGGSRMYPETDLLPISTMGIASEAEKMKVDPEATRRELEKEIGNKQLVEQMLWSKDLQLYKRIVKSVKTTPFVVASILLEKMKELKRITGNELAGLVSRYSGGSSKSEEVFKQIMLKYRLNVDAKELKNVLGVKDGI